MEYGGEIFGFQEYDSALQIYLRAARSFLGVNKTTPIPGMISEMNLLLPQHRAQLRMIRQFYRVLKSSDENMSRIIYLWDKSLNEGNIVSSWSSEIKAIFTENNMENIFLSGEIFDLKLVIGNLHNSMLLRQQNTLKVKCSELPKLRTYVLFKDFYSTPSYLKKCLSFVQRRFVAKIRLGCLEIRLETGRYARPRLQEEERICQICENNDSRVENELHFMFECKKYENERHLWLSKLMIPSNFLTLPPGEKFDLVLNNHCNVKLTSQYIINIFDIQSKIISSLPIPQLENIFHILPHDKCPACNNL